MEYCAAFIQLYREEAHYLERTAPWIERVGLTHIKHNIIDDDDNRLALAERFIYSQKFMQDDPWAARAKGEARYEFTPIKNITNEHAEAISE
jgi:nitrite reductase (NADH) large subunit